MAKADPTRNYYADLKIAPDAGDNEIRKAFRTLALQYHPDRNPGREAEFVVKFQEIQAAHEVLCDSLQRAKYDAERKKFRNLNTATNASSTPRTRPPPPRRDAPTTSTPSGSYYRGPPPKPFYQHQHQPQSQPQPQPQAQPQPQRPPPPQHHSTYNTYTTGADRFTSKNFRPPTAQRPDARDKGADAPGNIFTAWQKMKPPRAEEPRSTSSGAQQNNPNGQPFGRNQSTRMPSSSSSSSKKGFDPGTPGADEGQARSAYRSSYARPTQTPPSPTKDEQSSEVPYSEANRTRTPYYSSTAGERTSMFEGMYRPASMRNSPSTSYRPSSPAEAGRHSDSGRRQQRSSSAGRPKTYPHVYSDSSDDSAEVDGFQAGTQHRSHPPPPPPRQQSKPGWSQGVFSTPQPNRQSNSGPENASSAFKSRSEEGINIAFSPSDWHGKFEGSTDYFAPNMHKGSSTKARASPTRSKPQQRPAPERNPPSSQPTMPPPVPQRHFPPPPPGPPPNSSSFAPAESAAAAAAHPTKFSPQVWAESFKEPSWVLSGTDPRRASDATKRPKAVRKPSVLQSRGSKTQDEADSSRPRYQAFTEDADAMDIDSSTPPAPSTNPSSTNPSSTNPSSTNPLSTNPSSTRTQATPTSAAGMGTVPRSNGSASAPSFVGAALPDFGSNGTATGAVPKDSANAPPFVAAALPGFGLDGVGGIAKVEPFIPAQNGGLGMGELGDTLPYKSQPSSAHPTKPSSAQSLKFPDIPAAPRPPKKLDRDSTDIYLIQFDKYVKAYTQMRKKISAHLNARDAQFQDLDDHFVRSRGETTKKLGFASYMDKAREDERVFAMLGVVQEKHIQALEQCQEVRNKTIKLNPPHS